MSHVSQLWQERFGESSRTKPKQIKKTSRKNKPNISRLNPTSENLQLKIKARKCHPVVAVCSAGAFIHPSCRRGYGSFRSKKLILSSRPGRGTGITGVWSSCWLGSARPQWESRCHRVGEAQLHAQSGRKVSFQVEFLAPSGSLNALTLSMIT